ncbi:hypothetical protein Daus18300_012576 [Diaporthe australafricana]|uniref:Carrier domain-containing protein n=1 Tax=Diaporthe australafricana TaxID=127596 RepID=A0ABR3W2Z3_9PEZI
MEVGAGTGAVTLPILEKLHSDGAVRCAKYDYTDISPHFFAPARSKLEKYCDILDFRLCNIAEDPEVQSFELGVYDVIIASHVLHATENLSASLSNIRKLLKPDGTLVLIETTNPDSIRIGFLFGLLKDWWTPLAHEKRSAHSPCLKVEQWNAQLTATGFSGVDVAIPGQSETSSIVFSRAIASLAPRYDFKVIYDDSTQSQHEVASILSAMPGNDIWEALTLPQLKNTQTSAETVIVFLLELGSVFLHNISEVDYEDLKPALLRCSKLLWVARGSGEERPHQHLVDGLSRAIMSEDASKSFFTLALDTCDQSSKAAAETIKEVANIVAGAPVEAVENIFPVQGVYHVSRITHNRVMDEVIADYDSTRRDRECPMGGYTQLGMHIGLPGRLETLEWRDLEDGERDTSLLKQDEVLVRTRAIGLSRRDHEIATGQLDGTELGIDFAGSVLAAGTGSGFAPGDHVFAILPSTARTVMKVNSRALARFPSRLGFNEAASLPTSLWLAYHTLTNLARFKTGETILVCQGASCVGQMVIQIAKKMGAKILVTTSSEEKSRRVQDDWEVQAADIFQADDGSLCTKIMQRTQGRGVDVVVGFTKDSRTDFKGCLAPFARLVDTSISMNSSGVQNTRSRIQPANVSQSSINLLDLLHSDPQLVYKIFQDAVNMASDEHLKLPGPLLVFTPQEIRAAFAHFQNRDAFGKCIIEVKSEDSVTANVMKRRRDIFAPNASYVVAGGFGGLGRGILSWMADCGARNLIILSRSGARTEPARCLVNSLVARGVSVAAPAGDVSNLAALEECISQLRKSWPPIRGCVQATVALRDNLWENMTFDDWHVSMGSKVTGSWNLHTALPANLDFFVLMSSVNGLFGNRSQANYSAGNTFKDALAHNRIRNGQKAVSIDLGLMVDQGLVAENEKLLAGMRRIGHLLDIRMKELLSLMEHYCDPDLPVMSHEQAQVIVGIEAPAAVLAKGLDLHHSIRRPIFSHLFAIDRSYALRSNSSKGMQELDRALVLREAISDKEATELVIKWFRTKISQVLGLSIDDTDMSRPAHTYGIDSLVSIDLKNWFRREIGADVQVFNLLGNSPLEELAREATLQSSFRNSPTNGVE